jgi:hypothetical protein
VDEQVGTVGDDGSLEALGLTPGEAVRWRRREGGHWHDGVVIRREDDGSVAVWDAQGAWRSIRVDRLEVQAEGRRGARRWEPVEDRASRPTQLRLWDGTDKAKG